MRKRVLVVMLVVSALAAVGVTFWRAVEPARLQLVPPQWATTSPAPSPVAAPTATTQSGPALPQQPEAKLQAGQPAARPAFAKEEVLRVGGSLPGGYVASIEGGVPGGVVVGFVGGLPAPGRQNVYREGEIDRSSARFHTEAYDLIQDNPFLAAAQNPLSTFSIDVDTASYANVRRFLVQGQLPPKDAVRIEELLNYFRYDYPEPRGETPSAKCSCSRVFPTSRSR